jgi:hypothetical protein
VTTARSSPAPASPDISRNETRAVLGRCHRVDCHFDDETSALLNDLPVVGNRAAHTLSGMSSPRKGANHSAGSAAASGNLLAFIGVPGDDATDLR